MSDTGKKVAVVKANMALQQCSCSGQPRLNHIILLDHVQLYVLYISLISDVLMPDSP